MRRLISEVSVGDVEAASKRSTRRPLLPRNVECVTIQCEAGDQLYAPLSVSTKPWPCDEHPISPAPDRPLVAPKAQQRNKGTKDGFGRRAAFFASTAKA